MAASYAMEQIIASGQLVPFTFMQADVAASQTDVALPIAEVRDAAAGADDQNAAGSYVVPFDFDVIAISCRSSAARSAGTFTCEALIDGNATGLTAVLNATDTQSKHTVQRRGTDRGVAGGRIGARVTTDGSWAPATADIVVTVWAIVTMRGI